MRTFGCFGGVAMEQMLTAFERRAPPIRSRRIRCYPGVVRNRSVSHHRAAWHSGAMTYARGIAAAAFSVIFMGLLLAALGFMSATMTDLAWMQWCGYCLLAGVTLNVVGLVIAAIGARRHRTTV